MKEFLQKTKVVFGILLVAMLMLLPGVTAKAETINSENGKTVVEVSDLGDEKLYAFLATQVPNDDGYVYKEDLENMSRFMINGSQYETTNQIESFDKLVKYCPNITYVNIDADYLSDKGEISLLKQIPDMENLTYLSLGYFNSDNLSSDDISAIFNKNHLKS